MADKDSPSPPPDLAKDCDERGIRRSTPQRTPEQDRVVLDTHLDQLEAFARQLGVTQLGDRRIQFGNTTIKRHDERCLDPTSATLITDVRPFRFLPSGRPFTNQHYSAFADSLRQEFQAQLRQREMAFGPNESLAALSRRLEMYGTLSVVHNVGFQSKENRAQYKRHCKERGLIETGTNDELFQRVMEYDYRAGIAKHGWNLDKNLELALTGSSKGSPDKTPSGKTPKTPSGKTLKSAEWDVENKLKVSKARAIAGRAERRVALQPRLNITYNGNQQLTLTQTNVVGDGHCLWYAFAEAWYRGSADPQGRWREAHTAALSLWINVLALGRTHQENRARAARLGTYNAMARLNPAMTHQLMTAEWGKFCS